MNLSSIVSLTVVTLLKHPSAVSTEVMKCRGSLMKALQKMLLILLWWSLMVLHRQASAEAYTVHSASRSHLWKSPETVKAPNLSQRGGLTEAGFSGRTSLPVTIKGGSQRCETRASDGQATKRLLVRLRNGGSESESTAFWSKQFRRQLLAEFLGTGIVVGMGTGAVMSAIFTDSLVGLFQIASVWIIAVTIAIATTGPISGAHLNPAISVAFAWLRPSNSFGWGKVIPFIAAQTTGAVVFSWTNLLMYAGKIREFEAANSIVRGSVDSIVSAKAFGQYYVGSVTTPVAFFAEAFGTAFLSFVIFALTNSTNDTMKNKVYIPPLIGITVGGLISVLAPLTQAGFNPARDFGPRIVAWLAGWGKVGFQGWWLYVIAPLVGAPIGAWLADKVLYDINDE